MDVMRLATVTVQSVVAAPDMVAAVQALHERSADYVLRIAGEPPDAGAGRQFFEMLPPGKTLADKHTLGIFDGQALIGCIDLVRGWPDPSTAVIGLLLLEPAARGRGIGRLAFDAIEARARAWHEVQQLRAVVVETNARVRPFWEHMGFRANGQTRPHQAGTVTSTAVVFLKPLQR
jgi:GNAT superfamily N-acetyltransferase